MGHIQAQHIKKGNIPVGSKIIVLGGPAMLIGLGGGAASSINSGEQVCDNHAHPHQRWLAHKS
jgi:phosphoribosylformylglycinamidine synthase